MFRILFLVLALVFAGWVAWPAWSAWQIYSGMKSADEDVLRRKINWDSLRVSLRPVVAREVERRIGEMAGGGISGALMPQIRQKLMPQVIDMTMKSVVTPKGLAQVMAHGGDMTAAIGNVISSQMGKLGGLGALTGGGSGGGSGGSGGGLLGGLLGGGGGQGAGGLLGGLLGNKKVREMAGDKLGGLMKRDEPKDTAPANDKKGPSYGLGNIKRFAYTGLGSLEFGVAKDPAAEKPDITAVMEFQNFDWKLTGLVPRLN